MVTLGSSGVLVCGAREGKAPSPGGVDVVDTTGAGDAFGRSARRDVGGGALLDEAVRQTVAAASESTTAAGAHEGMPRRDHTPAAPDRCRNPF